MLAAGVAVGGALDEALVEEARGGERAAIRGVEAVAGCAGAAAAWLAVPSDGVLARALDAVAVAALARTSDTVVGAALALAPEVDAGATAFAAALIVEEPARAAPGVCGAAPVALAAEAELADTADRAGGSTVHTPGGGTGTDD